MATLSLTIFKAKALKGGRHKIRIAVRHRHETRYISTKFIVEGNQFRNGQVVKRPDAPAMNMKLRNLLNEYQERLDQIRSPDVYSCAQIKDMLAGCRPAESNTFQSVSKDFIESLMKEGRKSYAVSIERNSRYFLEFARGDVMLSDITPAMIEGYADFIRRRGVTETTVNTMMAQTKSVINRAVREQRVAYSVHPFLTTRIPSAPVRELDISVESFNKIRNSDPQRKRLAVARDLFCLSFFLGGMNLIDIMGADFRGGRLVYSRTKTARRADGAKVSVAVPEEASAIISKWMDRKTGKLDFGYRLSYHPFSQYVTSSLKILAGELNISERVTFYSARKSFAQYASEIGIPDGVIDYCLGHSDKSKGVIRYYTKVRERQADIAISRVIDYVKNPEKYRDFIEMRQGIMTATM